MSAFIRIKIDTIVFFSQISPNTPLFCIFYVIGDNFSVLLSINTDDISSFVGDIPMRTKAACIIPFRAWKAYINMPDFLAVNNGAYACANRLSSIKHNNDIRIIVFFICYFHLKSKKNLGYLF